MGTQLELATALRLPWRLACEAGVLLYRSVAGGLNRVGTAWSHAHERRRQLHDLLNLDERMLKDIGLERSTAEREARRSYSFWSA